MEQEKTYCLYSEIEKKDVNWLWYPYIPYGKITLLQGDPGDGKSTCMINLAACISVGGVLPTGEVVEKPQNVIYQCSEDNINDTIKPRLEKAGADCERIAFIDAKDTLLSITDDRIEKTIEKFNAKLVILDPIQAFLTENADMKSATKMRKTLSNLARISEKYECAIVLIGHMTKSNGGKHLYRGLGSIDIAAIARSVLMISRDEENPSIRYFFQVKNSIAPEGCAVAFIMDPICGFQWIGRCSGINALESAYDFNFEQKSKLEKAKELLKVALSLQPMKSKDVLNRLKKIDISERTIRKAVKELNIKSYQSKRVWYWKLPDEGMEGNEKE